LRWPWPVAPVADALEAIGIINQPLASIARREEIIYVPGQEGVPIVPDRFSPILHLVQTNLDEPKNGS
jgi:excinuclease ABC subunit C